MCVYSAGVWAPWCYWRRTRRHNKQREHENINITNEFEWIRKVYCARVAFMLWLRNHGKKTWIFMLYGLCFSGEWSSAFGMQFYLNIPWISYVENEWKSTPGSLDFCSFSTYSASEYEACTEFASKMLGKWWKLCSSNRQQCRMLSMVWEMSRNSRTIWHERLICLPNQLFHSVFRGADNNCASIISRQ